MRSEELRDAVIDFAAVAAERTMTVGRDQYDDGSGVQKFETLPISELFAWAEEELQDVVVYASMLAIRLQRLAGAVAFAATERGGDDVGEQA